MLCQSPALNMTRCLREILGQPPSPPPSSKLQGISFARILLIPPSHFEIFGESTPRRYEVVLVANAGLTANIQVTLVI